jgi:FlaA1/EpsC-like NDP-sugar epimerase
VILLPEMGEPVRIADLARRLLCEAGLDPDDGPRREVVGLRPGDKVEEDLVGEGETLVPSTIPGLREVAGPPPPDVQAPLARLEEAARRDDDETVRALLAAVAGLGRASATVRSPRSD